MRIRSYIQNRRLFTTFLLCITVCIVVTLLSSSYVYYRNYSGIALKQAFQSDLNSLNRTSKEINGMTASAQSLAFQIYRNSTIAKLLYYPVPHIFDVTAGMGEISNYLSSMPFIESILVYNSASETFYIAAHSGQNGIFTRNELADTGIMNVLEHFREYKPFTPIPRTYNTHSGESENISAYTYLCYDAINKNQTIHSAVIVNISAAWIHKEQAAEHVESPGQTYILDDQGRILSTNTLLPPIWSEPEARMILNTVTDRPSGYFIGTFNSEKSLISFTEMDSLGWQYVRVTPYHSITDTIGTIRNTTVTIAIFILAAGLLVSWLLSGILYMPIRRIMHKVNSLETEKRNNHPLVKQNALRALLLGSRTLSSPGKLEGLKNIGIAFRFQEDYRVVLLKIDRFQQLKKKRGADLPIYKFAIMNIATEILSDYYTSEAVDMDDDSVAVLVNVGHTDEPADDKVFLDRLSEIQRAVHDFLSISVSGAYSPTTNQPLHLHPLYGQVKEAVLHRMFYGHGCLIDSEEILALKSKEYLYPTEKEKRLTEAVMAGKAEEALELFTDMVQETSQYPIQVMRLAISHLNMTINNLIYTIQKNGALGAHGGLEVYMPSADDVETVEELTASFRTFVEEVRSKLAEKRSVKQGDLVRSVNGLIEKHYADPNLCLNWIADQLNLSSIYVSRVYKQQTLHAIVDVINDYRLDKAKAHLEGSDSSIADIADRTGYTSTSYFHRMFKKRFGVTPSEYRKAAGLKVSDQSL